MLTNKRYSKVALASIFLLALGCAAEWEQPSPGSGVFDEENGALSWAVQVQQKKSKDASLQSNNTKEDAAILQDSTEEDAEEDAEVEPKPEGCPSLYVNCPTCIGPDGTCQKNKVCIPGDDGVIS